jgi:hypothetical protein
MPYHREQKNGRQYGLQERQQYLKQDSPRAGPIDLRRFFQLFRQILDEVRNQNQVEYSAKPQTLSIRL